MKTVICWSVLPIILFCAAASASAYTYTYNNSTGYRVRVTAQLYDDTDKTGELEGNGSYAISSKSLLKSWSAETFLGNEWQRVLNMTCDLLPGDHTFTIYFDEQKDSAGAVTRIWNALIK